MALQIILEMSAAPREVPRPIPRRWRERDGILVIKQRPGRKPKPQAPPLDAPAAVVVALPVDDPIERLFRRRARLQALARDMLGYEDNHISEDRVVAASWSIYRMCEERGWDDSKIEYVCGWRLDVAHFEKVLAGESDELFRPREE